MELAIVGLPHVGKTTLFNALTRSHVDVGTYDASVRDPNRAAVPVADERLVSLATAFDSVKVTSSMVSYVDAAGLSTGSVSSGRMSDELLGGLRATDALVHVVRAFRSDHVPHAYDTLDPVRDVSAVEVEFAIADLQIVEKRLDRLVRELRAHKDVALQREQDLLRRCKETLESDLPLRELRTTSDEERVLRGFQFLTKKPMLLVLNMDERDSESEDVPTPLQEWAAKAHAGLVPICAETEAELADMSDEEAAAFRSDLGLDPVPAIRRVVRESQQLLNIITFYTADEKEVRAWALRQGSTALDAAGTIHSDLERGFIRAEAVAWDALAATGSYSKARVSGDLRLEGRDYIVQDGDVVYVRFNV